MDLKQQVLPSTIEKRTGLIAHATGMFEVKTWDEKTWDGKPWNEVSGAKLTHAIVTNVYQGDIEGEGLGQSLMSYQEDNTADFVGLERVTGRIGNRAGSFVLQGRGTFEDGAAKVKWVIVPGSAIGELRGLRGEGSYIARHGDQQVPFTLDYYFE